MNGKAKNQTCEVGVDEDGAIAIPPIEREQTTLAGPECGRLSGEFGMKHRFLATTWTGVFHIPGEEVANAALPGFVSPGAGRNAVLDDAADPFGFHFAIGHQEMASGSAHDHGEGSWFRHTTPRNTRMGIDIPRSDGDSTGKAQGLRHRF